jgi:hypothetical protein
MSFVCKNCNYSTNDKSNYIRHLNRKTKCNGKKSDPLKQNVNPLEQNVNPLEQNINPLEQNIDHFKNITNTLIQCNKCTKIMNLSNKNRHTNTCKGVPINVCHFCNKEFKSYSSKSKHISKHCKAKQQALIVSKPQNNELVKRVPLQTNHTITGDYANMNVHNGNNNIQINIAGQESDALLEKLFERKHDG